MTGGPEAGTERGAVLLVSLLVLLLIAVIAAALTRSNLLQVHMAGNTQAKIEALQQALALVDWAMDDESSTPVAGGPGYKICLVNSPDPDCDQMTLGIDNSLIPAFGTVDLAVTRAAPLSVPMPVMAERNASSSQFYRAAKFELRAGYDGTARGQGRAVVVQGVLVRIAKATN
jgi:type II secretory pathway pseudopilin PulG